MKKKLGFMILGAAMLFTLGAERAHASEVNHSHSNSIVAAIVRTPVTNEALGEDGNHIQPRLGFRWRCRDCNHVGAWQISYDTAAKHANNHHVRTGHNVYVYGV